MPGNSNVDENMRTLLIVIGISLLATIAAAQTQPQFNLMPMPSAVQRGTGQLPIDRTFSVSVTGFHDATLARGINRFVLELSRQTGISLNPNAVKVANSTLLIHAEHGREEMQKVGEDESYELIVQPSGAKLTAPNPLGILHGLQTFLQLVETEERRVG